MCFSSKLRQIFKVKQKEPEFEKVDFSNLMGFLRERHKEDMGDISRESDRIRSKVIAYFEEMRNINDSLNKIKAFDVLSRASVEVKNNFCEKVSSILSRSPDKGLSPESFIEESNEIIGRINAITPRQAAHIGFFFKEHVNKMADRMKSIKDAIEEYEEFISTSMLSDIREIEKNIAEIRESEKRISYIEKNMSEIQGETDDMKAKEQKHASKIPQVDKLKISGLKSAMAELNREKQSIEQEIDTEFGGALKVLKKYSHDIKDRKRKGVIDKYISSASWAFLTYDKDMEIKKILSDVKAELDSGRLDADEKQRVHMGSLLSSIQRLKKTKDRYEDVMKKIYERESELVKEERFSEKVGRMHDELKDVRGRITERNSMRKQLDESKAKVMESIQQKIKEIEFMISSDLGISIKIDYHLPGSPVYAPKMEDK